MSPFAVMCDQVAKSIPMEFEWKYFYFWAGTLRTVDIPLCFYPFPKVVAIATQPWFVAEPPDGRNLDPCMTTWSTELLSDRGINVLIV